ncbi:general secretion pathway protein GspB [uncultured Umboniibacter sp.]|uniref:general secretion pathway protein GspB n=1 Tax=uncultured Umboniibacter sp. TaxID=1798917 RepID=UPI0026361F46|nr:general secretion pathway protein GspB [uncultured Umboniibacter sp.]
MSSLLKAIEKAQGESPERNVELSDYASEALSDTRGSTGRSAWLLSSIVLASVSVIVGVAVYISLNLSEDNLAGGVAPAPVSGNQPISDSAIWPEESPQPSQDGESLPVTPVSSETEALYAEVGQAEDVDAVNMSAETTRAAEALWQEATSIADLPLDLMLELEEINYSAHVYNPESGEGFAFINGERLEAGRFLGIAQVQALVEQGVIFKARGTLFRIEALQDWELQLKQ